MKKQNGFSVFFWVLLVCLGLSCNPRNYDGEWTILYKNDKNGNTLLGAKSNVVKAIRKGADIKIGWQSTGRTRKIEHLSVPIWLAILNEKEVVAYLDPQVFADTDWDNLTASYRNDQKLKIGWRVVLTTQGSFDAVWYDRKNDSLIRRVPQKHEMTWFARF